MEWFLFRSVEDKGKDVEKMSESGAGVRYVTVAGLAGLQKRVWKLL